RSASPTSSSAVRAAACGSATLRPSATLASTLFHGTSRGSWNATDTGPAAESCPVTSRSSPASARSSVDLPEPPWPAPWPAPRGDLGETPGPVRRNALSLSEVAAPHQCLPLQQAHRAVEEQAEDCVDDERHHDHAVVQELLGLGDHE